MDPQFFIYNAALRPKKFFARNHETNDVDNIDKEISIYVKRGEELYSEIRNLELQMENLRINLKNSKEGSDKESVESCSYDKPKQYQKDVEIKDEDINNLNKQVTNLKEQINLLKNTLNQQKLTNELLTQNNNHITQQLLKVQEQFSMQTANLESISQECSSYKNQLKAYEDNTLQMLADVNKTWYKRVKTVISQKRASIEENEKLLTDVVNLKKELAKESRPLENAKKKFERIINHNYQFFEDMSKEQNEKIRYEMQIKNQLNAEVKRLNKEIRNKNYGILSMKRKIKILQMKNYGLKSRLEEINSIADKRVSKMYNKRSFGVKMNIHRQIDLQENVRMYRNICQSTLMQTESTNVSINDNRNRSRTCSSMSFVNGCTSPTAFSVRIQNIAPNVRVRDLKFVLRERGIVPSGITWKGYTGIAILHFSQTDQKMKLNRVDEVMSMLEGLSLNRRSSSSAGDGESLIIEKVKPIDDSY